MHTPPHMHAHPFGPTSHANPCPQLYEEALLLQSGHCIHHHHSFKSIMRIDQSAGALAASYMQFEGGMTAFASMTPVQRQCMIRNWRGCVGSSCSSSSSGVGSTSGGESVTSCDNCGSGTSNSGRGSRSNSQCKYPLCLLTTVLTVEATDSAWQP